MLRVSLNPELLLWARERAGLDQAALVTRFKKLPEWEDGRLKPTLKQLERYARAVHVPLGCLFLKSPPKESLPITDFRTIGGAVVQRPSPNLLDTIYACQERQDWYQDYAKISGFDELEFVGSANLASAPTSVAEEMRKETGFDLETRKNFRTWSESLRQLMKKVDQIGVLIMVNGVVNNNTQRKLSLAEFRGFALSDRYAPLIFVNGQDSKSAQIFTLAHELAHIWLGSTGLSNNSVEPIRHTRTEEVWCNSVAAEFLVPMKDFQSQLDQKESLEEALDRLARRFKVSTLVVLRRLYDADWIDQDIFRATLKQQLGRLQELSLRRSSGGNFYHTNIARVGERFARALISNTLEGFTLYKDAYRMLGVRKAQTFKGLVQKVGLENWHNI